MSEQPRETLQIRIIGSRSLIWWPISAFWGDPTSCKKLLFSDVLKVCRSMFLRLTDTEYLTVYQLLDLKK
uniref:Uncharacterized protein n=1 Tax=Spermophilus dauricus TaxID=99837 RepID=A0A8C9P9P9_SPEDA